jgi:uncharacterized membrane protein
MRSDEIHEDPTSTTFQVEGLDGRGSDLSRIISISDAVFAFSLTFLVIDLVLPTKTNAGYPDLGSYLGAEWPLLVAYALSFFIIISWWGAHRRLFSPIVRYDEILVRLNSLFLFIIAVTPFLVGILYDYGPGVSLTPGTRSTELAVAIYASVQVVEGGVLLGIWRHSTRGHRLVEPRLPMHWIRVTESAQLQTVVIFALSIPIAFVAPFLSMLMWIVVIAGSRQILFARFRRQTRSASRSRPPEQAPGT